jgi:type II secretory pathway pseudopilin PulG
MPPTPCRQDGFTFLALLFFVVALGVGMAAIGTLWNTAAQREKEKELLFAGDQYRRAIESFWKAAPKGAERLPKSLDELLLDPRNPQSVRHLRRLYPDPMTDKTEWGLKKDPDGGIRAVFSLSTGMPLKRANFPYPYDAFAEQLTYAGWQFAADNLPDSAGAAALAGKDKSPSFSAPGEAAKVPLQ